MPVGVTRCVCTHVAVAINIEPAPLRRFNCIVAQQLLHLEFGVTCPLDVTINQRTTRQR